MGQEAKIQGAIKRWLKAQGWFVLKLIQLSDNGYPDLYCHKDGRTVWIEVKAPGEDLEPLQKVRQAELRGVGMEAYGVDSIEEVKRIAV